MARIDRHQVTVLLGSGDDQRFSAYCEQRGFKKSTLIVRLIREHLDREGFAMQATFFDEEKSARTRSTGNATVSSNRAVKRGHS